MKEYAKEHFHEEQLDNILDMLVLEAEEAGVSVKGVENGSTQDRLQDLFDAYRDKCVKTSYTVKQKTWELKQAKADHELVVKGHKMVRQTNEKEVSRLKGELEREALTESNKEAVAAVEKLHQEIQDLEHVREDCRRLQREKNELVHLKEAIEREREQLLREELLPNKKEQLDVRVEQRVEIEKLKTKVAQLNHACTEKDQKIQDLEKVSHKNYCSLR